MQSAMLMANARRATCPIRRRLWIGLPWPKSIAFPITSIASSLNCIVIKLPKWRMTAALCNQYGIFAMIESYSFLKLVMDSITEHIVVIDRDGVIQFANQAWHSFGEKNAYPNNAWQDINYLEVCDDAAAMGDEIASAAAEGIRKVVSQGLASFYLEYPCHSPNEKRWFMMQVTPLEWQEKPYFVISHQNITERKLAEEKALSLSRTDGLTSLANRRYFDEFLEAEWRRCTRQNLPISLAIIDIDHFKLLNDHDGHQSGDDCLVTLAAVLNQFCQRPGDLLARYGGDEFMVIFGQTNLEQSQVIIRNMMEAVDALQIPNTKSPVKPTVSISVANRSSSSS